MVKVHSLSAIDRQPESNNLPSDRLDVIYSIQTIAFCWSSKAQFSLATAL